MMVQHKPCCRMSAKQKTCWYNKQKHAVIVTWYKTNMLLQQLPIGPAVDTCQLTPLTHASPLPIAHGHHACPLLAPCLPRVGWQQMGKSQNHSGRYTHCHHPPQAPCPSAAAIQNKSNCHEFILCSAPSVLTQCGDYLCIKCYDGGWVGG